MNVIMLPEARSVKGLTGLGLVALLLTNAACTQHVVLREPDPMLAAHVVAPKFPALPDAGQQAQSGASIATLGWQEFFSNRQLKTLIERTLANNRDLRTAALNIEQARAQYQIREVAELPSIAANGTAVVNRVGGAAGKAFQVGLGSTAYEIDLWGRVANLKDAALQTYLATQQAQHVTQISLIGQIAQAYLAIAMDQEQIRLGEQTLKTQLHSLQLNELRLKAGIDSAVPTRQTQISVETARLAIANAKTQRAQDINLLTLLVGQTIPQTLIPSRLPDRLSDMVNTRSTAGAAKTPNGRMTRSLSTGLPSDLLLNRPDIRAAEYNLKAAGANIAVARAAYYPTISLTGSLGLSSPQLSNLFKSGSFGYSFGPSITLPIFDAGSRKANLEVSKVNQQLALTSYEKTIQTAFREVADALATRAYIQERLDAQLRLVNATRSNYELSVARSRAGLDNYLTVLTAQLTTFNAEQNLLILQQAALLSDVNLYKVLGGGGFRVQGEWADTPISPAS